jgi:hypothetical protein
MAVPFDEPVGEEEAAENIDVPISIINKHNINDRFFILISITRRELCNFCSPDLIVLNSKKPFNYVRHHLQQYSRSSRCMHFVCSNARRRSSGDARSLKLLPMLEFRQRFLWNQRPAGQLVKSSPDRLFVIVLRISEKSCKRIF